MARIDLTKALKNYREPNKYQAFVVKSILLPGMPEDFEVTHSRLGYDDAHKTAYAINRNIKIKRKEVTHLPMGRERAEHLFKSGKLRDPKGLL